MQSLHDTEQLYLLFENHLKENIFYNVEPRQLYDAVNHIMNMSGKRIRPLLLMMAADMFGADVNMALNPAMGVELFHNATLVHDDIMDQADIRRGQQTVHKLYGINHAIVTGDVMMIYAYQYLLRDHPQHLLPLIHIFNKTTTEIMEGQTMDLAFEERMDVTEAEYIRMIEYKTSVLLAASLQIGAIIADADLESQQRLYKFGLDLGLSFQIKDDLLDAFGESGKVGKKTGGDILQNKKTFLFITARKKATDAQRAQLQALMKESNSEVKVRETLHLFELTGARAITEQKAADYFDNSLRELEKVKVDAGRKEPLIQLAHRINNREY